MSSRRPGYSLTELLVALTLAAVIGSVLFGTLAVQVRLARMTALRAAETEAVRTTLHVLTGETRRMTPRDVRAVSAESLAVRAFRGVGIPCTADGHTVTVRYRGERAPDPRKDSVVVVPAPGHAEYVSALVAVGGAREAACVAAGGESLQAWTLSEEVRGEAVLLLFESGSFYLTAGALRYRLGGEGRQPLTGEVFRAPTGFHSTGPDNLQVTLRLASGATVRSWTALSGFGPP